MTRDAVQEFWKWFGKVLHILRHQKPVPELWSQVRQKKTRFSFWFSKAAFIQGLIFGFISKEAAQDLLRGRPVGTFLIRFSEQSAGQFAVACVAKVRKAKENFVLFFMDGLEQGKKAGENVIKVLVSVLFLFTV